MTIDVFTATGTKKGTMSLPDALFAAPINKGLIHQALMLQRSNRRHPIAHAKNRSEVVGSTRKLYGQKHTGRARRGPIRSPLLRGGGKAFGPRKDQNFSVDMPRAMRIAALCSCLSYQAKRGIISGLENYPDTIKTREFVDLLEKMKLDAARSVLFVLPEKHHSLWMSSRNVPSAKTVLVSYLNPEDVIHARSIVFVGDSIKKAEEIFGRKKSRIAKETEVTKGTKGTEGTKEKKVMKPKHASKKPIAKKVPDSK